MEEFITSLIVSISIISFCAVLIIIFELKKQKQINKALIEIFQNQLIYGSKAYKDLEKLKEKC